MALQAFRTWLSSMATRLSFLCSISTPLVLVEAQLHMLMRAAFCKSVRVAPLQIQGLSVLSEGTTMSQL
ncbi:hypothetical protein D3C81_1987540 [compost metagenome]